MGDDGDADYTYDETNQLTDANYDGEGNRIARFENNDAGDTISSGDTNITIYTWDHRNRLTKVTEYATYANYVADPKVPSKIVEYAYDHANRWVRKTLDTTPDGTPDSSRIFIHDAGQIVLDLKHTGTGDATTADLSHRYLWGDNVDELLADETTDDGTADDVAWTLADHQNTVRDLVQYNPATEAVTVAEHITYDAFGNVTTPTPPTSLFLYTARPFDPDSALQNNLNRWYDAAIGRWISADPIGFLAGDANLYRYCGNGGLNAIDPDGLDWKVKRNGGSRAIACNSGSFDTIADLARIIGLNENEYRSWLKSGDKGPLPSYENNPLGACRRFNIPNTMVSVWYGELKGLGRFLVNWNWKNSELRMLGFKTEIMKMPCKTCLPARLGGLSSQKMLHGIFVTGHGSKTGFGTAGTSNWKDNEIWGCPSDC